MSMVEPTRYRPESDRPPEGVFLSADSGASWPVFAGTMIGLLSVLNMIYGIAAVSDSKVFVANTEFVFGGLHTWGWILIAISVTQAVTAVGVFAQVQVARWAGVVVAFANALITAITIPAYPWWSLALFVLDMLVIYGLIAHGAKEE